jgi:hypothetical protein
VTALPEAWHNLGCCKGGPFITGCMACPEPPRVRGVTEEDLEAMGPSARASFEATMEAYRNAPEDERDLPREL